MSVNQRLNFGFGRRMKIRYKNLFLPSLLVDEYTKLYFSSGNRYIEGISHRLAVTSQAR